MSLGSLLTAMLPLWLWLWLCLWLWPLLLPWRNLRVVRKVQDAVLLLSAGHVGGDAVLKLRLRHAFIFYADPADQRCAARLSGLEACDLDTAL